jgi:hypothetical protein
MFRQSRAAKARSAAEDAWDALTSAWESTRDRTGDLVEETQERFGSATDEARQRASAALDAIAGRRPSRPWALLFGAVAAGAVVGWIAAAAVGRAPGLSALEQATAEEPTQLPTTS